jgi:endonuclease/exonuclease/phosphatase family metal-dependent hydrolase
MDCSFEIMCWNVRGLNDPAKRDAVREFVASLRVSVICLQETMLDVLDNFLVMQCLGPTFDGYVYLPTVETRGEILLAWNKSIVDIERVSFDPYAVTGEVTPRYNNRWWITTVYGPQTREEKLSFLFELAERRSLCPGPWLLLGDFNMIFYAEEKNNDRLDRFMMTRFRHFVQEHEIKDLYLHGRRFTWSNEREVPTLTRIDRDFASVDWDLMHPVSVLRAMSSSVSDHAPIHLSLSAAFKPKRRFKFEAFWLNLKGFEEALREAWVCDPSILDPFRCLDALFCNAAEFFQAWGEKKVGNIKLKIAMVNTFILRFDVAQEARALSPAGGMVEENA